MTQPSRSQVDRLGYRIRSDPRISDSDLEQLQLVRAAHDDAMAAVTVALHAVTVDDESLAPTSRLKTVGTIVDKLRRESVRLSQMQDIAGVRLVVDGGRLRQDRVVEAIRRRLPGSRVVDRRENPSHGYRAVHVMVRQGPCWVEVQVRTVYQDLWAQLFERLADAWGRQIRYGDPPDDPMTEVVAGTSRQAIVEGVLALADSIAEAEKAEAGIEILETTVTLGELEEEVQESLLEATETGRELLEEFRRTLAPLIALLGDV